MKLTLRRVKGIWKRERAPSASGTTSPAPGPSAPSKAFDQMRPPSVHKSSQPLDFQPPENEALPENSPELKCPEESTTLSRSRRLSTVSSSLEDLAVQNTSSRRLSAENVFKWTSSQEANDLWDFAYDELKKEPGHLMEGYEVVISNKMAGCDTLESPSSEVHSKTRSIKQMQAGGDSR